MIGLFQGSFDPVTKGHIDIIKRASQLFDKLYVVVAVNKNKKYMFTKEEREMMIVNSIVDIPNVVVDSWDGLVVDYANKKDVKFFVRGIRDIKDFEYERIEESYNKDLDKNIQTIYMTNDEGLGYVSSSGVKELLLYNKNVDKYVTKPVLDMIEKKRKEGKLWSQVI